MNVFLWWSKMWYLQINVPCQLFLEFSFLFKKSFVCTGEVQCVGGKNGITSERQLHCSTQCVSFRLFLHVGWFLLNFAKPHKKTLQVGFGQSNRSHGQLMSGQCVFFWGGGWGPVFHTRHTKRPAFSPAGPKNKAVQGEAEMLSFGGKFSCKPKNTSGAARFQMFDKVSNSLNYQATGDPLDKRAFLNVLKLMDKIWCILFATKLSPRLHFSSGRHGKAPHHCLNTDALFICWEKNLQIHDSRDQQSSIQRTLSRIKRCLRDIPQKSVQRIFNYLQSLLCNCTKIFNIVHPFFQVGSFEVATKMTIFTYFLCPLQMIFAHVSLINQHASAQFRCE